MAVSTGLVELATLPISSITKLLGGRCVRIDRIQREYFLDQLHEVLSTGLKKSWVVDQLPQLTNMHPRCWGAAVLQPQTNSVLYFGGRDMSKFGEDAHQTLLSWKCGETDVPWEIVKMTDNQWTPRKSWGYAAVIHSGILYLFGGQDYVGRNNDLYMLEWTTSVGKKLSWKL
eukprot:6229580-Pyramimonas_sp.AAC.2